MTKPVPANEIEDIVGAQRHPMWHIARAVSSEQTVYILHSQHCLKTYGRKALIHCPFSLALDNGIDIDEWDQDRATVVGISGAQRLVPSPA